MGKTTRESPKIHHVVKQTDGGDAVVQTNNCKPLEMDLNVRQTGSLSQGWNVMRSSTHTLESLRKSKAFALFLFAAVVILLFADQSLLAPNLSQIADDFNFTNQV